MLPIVDKPTIQYIIEEAVASGIEEILIITGRNKRAIEDHFDKSFELEMTLKEKGKFDLLKKVEAISDLADIYYIRQKEPKGLGHAIYCAKTFIGDEPFAVLLGDDIVYHKDPCLKQMINIFDLKKSTVLGVQSVPEENVSRYGIVDGKLIDENLYKVKSLIEKPDIKEAPTNVAIVGRYIITPRIFDLLENIEPGKGGEIQLTDALIELAKIEDMYAYEFTGKRYDIGNVLGFLEANIEFGLRNKNISKDLKNYLSNLGELLDRV
jgi:UTP--glucose-1-phosphate uridylyltransferase